MVAIRVNRSSLHAHFCVKLRLQTSRHWLMFLLRRIEARLFMVNMPAVVKMITIHV